MVSECSRSGHAVRVDEYASPSKERGDPALSEDRHLEPLSRRRIGGARRQSVRRVYALLADDLAGLAANGRVKIPASSRASSALIALTGLKRGRPEISE